MAARILVVVEEGRVTHIFCDQQVEVVVRDNDVIQFVTEAERDVYLAGEYNPLAVNDAFEFPAEKAA
jgi:hypothetical protein